MFDTVESIRQNAVRFHRDEDAEARRALEETLNSLPPGEALQIIRAFGFFSHLANIAEDQHHIRRTRAHALADAAPRDGTMAQRSGPCRAGRASPPSGCGILRRRADRPGADRASDRGAPQEHDRPRDGGRATCSPSATGCR